MNSIEELTQEEFDRRVQENTQTFIKQYKKNEFNMCSYHLATHSQGELSVPILMFNIHDIYAAALIGALAIPETKGKDAVIMKNGKKEFFELKTSYLSSESTWVNETTNNVHSGTCNTHNNRRSLASSLKATFKLKKTLEKYTINTVLICVDALSGKVICSYILGGDDLYDILLKSHANNIRSTSVTLSTFMTRGQPYDTIVPQTGYDNWKDHLRKTRPILKEGEFFHGG